MNIGGVNSYRKSLGSLTLTYVAPWAPEENICCGMGYGLVVPKSRAAALIPYLGLQKPAAAARPYPWNESKWAQQEYLLRWRVRDWQGWLAAHLVFPFQALVAMPPRGAVALMTVKGLLDVSAEQARRFGIHLECPRWDEVILAGATALTPIDIESPNMSAIAEYQAFRSIVGPPPGSRDTPGLSSTGL